MQPMDQMSTGVLYSWPPSRISGARYSSVTTWAAMCICTDQNHNCVVFQASMEKPLDRAKPIDFPVSTGNITRLAVCSRD